MHNLEQIYRRYLACCNERRFGDLDEFVHPTFRMNGEETTLAEYKRVLSSVVEAVPDFHWEIQDIVASSEKVAVRIISSGTPVSTWMGMQPTGDPFKAEEHAFYIFANGRMADTRFIFGAPSIQAELGSKL